VERVTSEEEWTNFETILKTTAEEIIGKIKRDFRKGWFDQDCEQMTVEKSRKYQSMLQRNLLEQQEKNTVMRERKKKGSIRRERRIIMKNNLIGYKNVILNDSRKFYKQVNRTRDGFQDKPLSCRGTDGDILSDKADILNRWKEYYVF
jgi:hypothetical protein